MSATLLTELSNKAAAAPLALGLWKFNDQSSAFVVFDDDDGERKAFLLGDWRGRPGYTRMPVSEAEDCKFVAEVAITPTDYASFTAMSAMLGKLVIKEGRALIKTVTDTGNMALAPIAPLYPEDAEDEDCHYCWMLVDKSNPDAEFPGLCYGTGHSSWLNFWTSPEYEVDEAGCPVCGQDFLDDEDEE